MRSNKGGQHEKVAEEDPGIYHGCGNGRRSSCLRQLCIHVPVRGGLGQRPAVSDEPIKISMYYADNPTLPYMDSWLAVQETAKIAGVDLTVEAIPSTDYNHQGLPGAEPPAKIVPT